MIGALEYTHHENNVAPRGKFDLSIRGRVGLFFIIKKKMRLAYTLGEDCFIEISVYSEKPGADKLVLLNTEKLRGDYLMEFDAAGLDKGRYKIVMTAFSLLNSGAELFSKKITLGIMG